VAIATGSRRARGEGAAGEGVIVLRAADAAIGGYRHAALAL
jgi:hypothetical protein